MSPRIVPALGRVSRRCRGAFTARLRWGVCALRHDVRVVSRCRGWQPSAQVQDRLHGAAGPSSRQSGGYLMTTQFLDPGRRTTVLGAVIGAVLASYAGSAAALEWEGENGTRVIWNTTISVGSSWRAEEPSPELFTRA